MPPPRRTAPGFEARDWLLVAAVALMWGSSFLLIKIGLDDFPPATVAWLRLLFGAATLALLPAARAPLRRRRDWLLIVVLGLAWMAAPFTLFAVAEQHIASALAGMINGATPLFTAAIALAWFRYRPDARLVAGLVVGFAGVLLVNLPALDGETAAALTGVGMVLLATIFYGVAFNLAEPLEDRNGPLSVILRAELAAVLALTPAGVIGLGSATPHLGSWAAMLSLGALSTGVAFACFILLLARVGAARASVTVYLVPVVAIVLGAALASEAIAPLSVAGIALVLLGAFLAAGRARKHEDPAEPDPMLPGVHHAP